MSRTLCYIIADGPCYTVLILLSPGVILGIWKFGVIDGGAELTSLSLYEPVKKSFSTDSSILGYDLKAKVD